MGSLWMERTSTLAGRPIQNMSVQFNRNIYKNSRFISSISLTLIFVAPFTDFSNELAISTQGAQEGACDSHLLRAKTSSQYFADGNYAVDGRLFGFCGLSGMFYRHCGL